ncbi:MAG: cation diffusion facilitator family transporter [Dehalococcoidia bacterium]|nr:cation diffusion facilitator family transporter [Dehalococcoidia bacterium]
MTGPVRIAAISLGTTVCLLALKLSLGIISGSIAVLSDAIDSGTDLVGGTAALISVRVAIWPADEDHPYGHGKVESISASVAATVVAFGCGFVVFQAVRRLVEGSPEIHVVVGVAPMIVAALANVLLAHYMRREARSSQSLALASESTHLQTNVVQAMAVIAGLTAVAITNERLFDPLAALGLAAYMAWTAVHLAREALTEIMDVALPDQELRAIHDVIAAHKDDIRGFHRLRSRRAGPTRHVDMHLIVDPQRTVEEAHTVCDEIEREILEYLPGAVVTIHLEPDDGRYRGPLERILHERG